MSTQETRIELVSMIAELVGEEEAAQYNGLPVKALHAILAAKKAEYAAKAEAAKATAQAARATQGTAKTKEPKPSKKARALQRTIEDTEGKNVELTQAILGCHLGAPVSEVLYDTELTPAYGQNVGAIRTALGVLYRQGLLSPEMNARIQTELNDKEG